MIKPLLPLMIILAGPALAQEAQDPQEPAAQADEQMDAQRALSPEEQENLIVVIGRKLDQISVNVGQDQQGRWHCGLSQSSGSLKIDEKLCKVATKCVQKLQKKKMLDDVSVKNCINRKKPDLIRDFKQELAKHDD